MYIYYFYWHVQLGTVSNMGPVSPTHSFLRNRKEYQFNLYEYTKCYCSYTQLSTEHVYTTFKEYSRATRKSGVPATFPRYITNT